MPPAAPHDQPVHVEATFTPSLPRLLFELRCAVVVSAYQSGRVILLSSPDGERLRQASYAFARPMALSAQQGRLAVSTATTIELFRDARALAASHPAAPDACDALYLPRRTWHTGRLDVHGVDWDAQGRLWMVNTRFDGLALASDEHAFDLQWTPPFLKPGGPGDRCHLNGVAFADGAPRYTTCLGTGTAPQSWRDGVATGGAVLDVAAGAVVAHGLAMPHSPRVVDDALIVLLAATGDVARVDPRRGDVTPFARVRGFARGLAHHGAHLFVGTSRLRSDRAPFGDLPIARSATEAGVTVLDARSGAEVASLTWSSAVDEVFDVAVLPDTVQPVLGGPIAAARAVSAPDGDWWLPAPEGADARAKALRRGAGPVTGYVEYLGVAPRRKGPSALRERHAEVDTAREDGLAADHYLEYVRARAAEVVGVTPGADTEPPVRYVEYLSADTDDASLAERADAIAAAASYVEYLFPVAAPSPAPPPKLPGRTTKPR